MVEVPAEHRHAELARSPLRQHARLIHKWGLSLFLSRRFCPAPDNTEFLAETWELEGVLYGWRIFAAVHKISRRAVTDPNSDADSEEGNALEGIYGATKCLNDFTTSPEQGPFKFG